MKMDKSELDKVNRDAMIYGQGFMRNGKHIPFEEVVVCYSPIESESYRLRKNQIDALEVALNKASFCKVTNHGAERLYDQDCRVVRGLTPEVISKINIEANKYPLSQMYESELRAINLTAKYVCGEIDL